MIEHILIKQFFNGLHNEVSRECVILKALKPLLTRPSLRVFQRAPSESHATTPRLLRHRVQCPASALDVVDRAVAFVGSRFAAENSWLHAIASFVVADEVARADAWHSVSSHTRQAVALSSDKVNKTVHAQSSTSTVKSWVTTRVTAAIARALATVKVNGPLKIKESADPKAARSRTSSTGWRPSLCIWARGNRKERWSSWSLGLHY